MEKLKIYWGSIRTDWYRVRDNPRPNTLQVIRFWSVFSLREKKIFAAVAGFALISGGFFITQFFETHIISAPDTGGSYTEGVLQEPRFVNPIFATNETEQSIVNLIFQGLFRYNQEGVLVPSAAESYTVSPDEKSYTITLRQGNRWQDGQQFTVDDVLFTIATIQNPEYKSSLRPNWQGVTVERTNDTTVTFHLRQPYAPFLQNLTVGILPKHLWDSIRPEYSFQSDLNMKPIGSGPYQFKKLTRTTGGSILSYTLERSSFTADGSAYIDTIAFQVFDSEEVMLSSYQRGKINGMSVVSSKNEGKISASQGKIYAADLPQVFAIFLNQTQDKELSDPLVREALDISIDRNQLIEKVLNGGGIPLGGPIPPGSIGFNPLILVPEKNTAGAKELLQKAGYTMNMDTHIWEKKTKKTAKSPETVQPLHITITTSQWPDLVEVGKFITKEWEDIGIDVSLETVPIAGLEHDRIQPRSYDALLFGESFGHDPDAFAFWHSSQVKSPGVNLSLYANKKVDGFLESARRAKGTEDAADKYRQFQEILVKDRPAIFLYAPRYFFVMDNAVKGYVGGALSRGSERFQTIDSWFINTDWKLK